MKQVRSANVSCLYILRNDPSRGQQKRNVQPTVSGAMQPAAQYSNPTGMMSQQTFANPYQNSYPPNPAFGYPPQARMQHQGGLQQPLGLQQQQSVSPTNSRKRRGSEIDNVSIASGSGMSAYSVPQQNLMSGQVGGSSSSNFSLGAGQSSAMSVDTSQAGPSSEVPSPVVKKGRTNTPWTPAEEQRLKVMRDAGNSWSEIAKTFPARTEGSVKKHWYKVRILYCPMGCYEGSEASFHRSMLTRVNRTCIMPSLRKTREVLSDSLWTSQTRSLADNRAECGAACGHQGVRSEQVESDWPKGRKAGKGVSLTMCRVEETLLIH